MLEAVPLGRTDARPTTVVERIAAWARRRPSAVAVAGAGRSITYAGLGQRIEVLANRLRQQHVRPDEPVAVHLERSVDAVVAAVAVLRAGAAYLMLDARAPAAWTRRLVEDSGARLALTRPDLWTQINATSIVPLDVSGTANGTPPPRVASADVAPAPDALAYLCYTSGSTGNPKGVLVEHAGLTNLVDWYLDRYRVGPGDRLTQLARPSFDAFALEVWPCLAAGATLHIVDTALLSAPEALRDWMLRTGITVSFVPTPLAEHLLDLPWPARGRLRDMLTGGDRLAGHPRAALPFRLHNNYGPTECTVVATCGEVAPAGAAHEPPPIGRPIPGITAHVLDPHRRPVPDGQPGELHVGGVGVARGYVRGPQDRFWPDPFRGEPGARLYATGDLVRRAPDGQLHFLGRVDEQIQVRGFRVEPAEIESALLRHPAVRQTAVVARARGEAQLIAVVVARDGGADPAQLRGFLREQLPEHLVPGLVVVLDRLPMTAHGKVDRRLLAELSPHSGATDTIPDAEPDAGPSASLERTLSDMWTKVLGLDVVDPQDSFFDIGGDSLRVIRLISLCRRGGIVLRPEDVYAHPVLRDLARAIHQRD